MALIVALAIWGSPAPAECSANVAYSALALHLVGVTQLEGVETPSTFWPKEEALLEYDRWADDPTRGRIATDLFKGQWMIADVIRTESP